MTPKAPQARPGPGGGCGFGFGFGSGSGSGSSGLASGFALLCWLALPAACTGAGHETHSEPWEWSGVFHFPASGHYVWTAARAASGSYAAADLKLVVQSISPATPAALEAAHGTAEQLWNGGMTSVSAGGEVEVVNRAYRLVMDTRTWVSQWELHVDTPGYYAFFTDPAPTDFENGFHYLRTEAGANVEPVLQEQAHSHSHGHGHASAAEELAHQQAALCPAEMHWEWAGTFNLNVNVSASGWYTWSAARGTGGSYADASMKLLILPVANTSEHELEEAQTAAMPIWDGSSTAKTSGQDLVTGTLMELTFDTHSWASHFYLSFTGGHVAIFAQHLPTEFENGFHYLKTAEGADVEPTVQKACAAPSPAAQAASASTHDGLWGAVIVGALVTCLPTLLGVLFVFPERALALRDLLERLKGPINSFASGAIFAAAVFLLLPEALHLAGSGHSEEVVGTWTWGTSILFGWFTCLALIQAGKLMGFGEGMGGEVRTFDTGKDGKDATEASASTSAEDDRLTVLKRSRIIAPVIFGDFFHNFADGLVLGVAFKVCGSSFGWELVGVTVAHELPQEVADLCILVLNAKMKWWKATALNFLCSFSTVIGAIITYAADVGSNEEGYILAYGAGVYLFVAITELGHSMAEDKATKVSQYFVCMACFVFGAVLIGLVLLNHEHCSAAPVVAANGTVVTPVDSHAGHNH